MLELRVFKKKEDPGGKFAGCGDTVLHATDESTGKDLRTAPLTGTDGRQYVVIATGNSEGATLVAFAP